MQTENFFYYGYGASNPTRCNLIVDYNKKTISIVVGKECNPENVENLHLYGETLLYKFSK